MCDEKTVVWSGPSSVKCNLNPTNYINTTALGDVECGRSALFLDSPLADDLDVCCPCRPD